MAYQKPDDVRSPKSKWTLIRVLDDKGEDNTSLALGRWEDHNVLAIRWNGSDDQPLGSPQSRGLPTWFIIPDHLVGPILTTLPTDMQTLVRSLIDIPEA